MSLDAAFAIGTASLAAINAGFTVVSQNVANAGTAGYSAERATQSSIDAGGLALGVRSGPAIITADAALSAAVQAQQATTAGLQTSDAALSALQPAFGAVGQGSDLTSLLGGLQTAFSALQSDPGNQAGQAGVVGAAQNLAQGINSLSAAYGATRQNAQDALVGEVAVANTALARVGDLSSQIVALKAQGLSTADLENARNQALSTLSNLADTHFLAQPNGDVTVLTAGGAELPTRETSPLSIAAATTGSTASYPGGLPGILLGGTDITRQLTGGSIAANIALRDTTIPTYQAELDEFSQNLAGRFSAQGLDLFTDTQGQVPVRTGATSQAGYVGIASTIQVNPLVTTNPALVRDGTQAVAGSATGASAFTPNPQNLAGFTGLITRVLDFTLGDQVQAGVPQTPGATAGLGPSGNLAAPFSPVATLSGYATAITATQSADAANAATAASDATATQSTLRTQLSSQTGVNLDSELARLVQLQTAYGASAKIISTVQSMYTTLLNAVH